MQSMPLKRVLIMDTSSTDGTAELARSVGYEVVSVRRSEFNHGGTRQSAANLMADVDILVYLTQDAFLANEHSIENIVAPFRDPDVGAVCGRQLPRKGAGLLESHAREFNYPAQSIIRDLKYRDRAGFKAIFASNSFSAYRACALRKVGGIPSNVIVSEETVVFARMLLNGWKTAYAGDATVYHSHDYTLTQEFRRYFDIGVLHSREKWLLEEFGNVKGEGVRFFLSELKMLWPSRLYLVPASVMHTIVKLAGYQLGRHENKLSRTVVRSFSQQKSYWVQDRVS
jgi:rhamnosyltransferase